MEYLKEADRYGKKRSIWTWIGIYLVAAVIVYGAGFLIYREARDGGADDNGGTTQSQGIY